MFAFLRARCKFLDNMNAAKGLVSHFDSFRGLSSVKEFSCTDINVISDLGGSPVHQTTMQTEMFMVLLGVFRFFSSWIQDAWSWWTWRSECIFPLIPLRGTWNREPGGLMGDLHLLLVNFLHFSHYPEGMRAPSMAPKHLLWHLVSAGITDIWWWHGDGEGECQISYCRCLIL